MPANGGVYLYGAGGFPTQTYNASNYWVDVVLSTAPPADTTPPTITGFNPTNGTAGVATSSAVTITFSEALNASTINTTTIRLLDGAVAVAATVSYNASTNTVTLTPSAPLSNSKFYTISITGGASGVKDSAGNPLATTVTSAFTTVAAPTTPTVTGFTPTNGSSGVATGAAVTITFSEALNASTVNTTTIRLLDGAVAVAATVSYNASTNTVTLTPSAPLSNSKTYTISVTGGASGVKNVAGNSLAATVTSAFTTVAAVTTPTVTGFTPANGSSGVPTGAAVTITFSEALNASTVNTTTVRLLDGAVAVSATVSYNAGTNTVTLTPMRTAVEFQDLHDLCHWWRKRREERGWQLAGGDRYQRVYHSRGRDHADRNRLYARQRVIRSGDRRRGDDHIQRSAQRFDRQHDHGPAARWRRRRLGNSVLQRQHEHGDVDAERARCRIPRPIRSRSLVAQAA